MRYIIIEDERFAYEDIRRMMERLRPDYRLVGWATGVEQGAMMLRETEADLLISDIQLDDGLVFDLFDMVGTDLPIIFTTAYDEYALRAFKVNGVDYLLKPINEGELNAALTKMERNQGLEHGMGPIGQLRSNYLQGHYKQRFLVCANKSCYYVQAKDVAALYADNKYTTLQTMTGEEKIINYTIDQLEKVMDPDQFFCVTRGVILNINNIVKTSHNERGWMQVTLKVEMGKMLKNGTLSGKKVTVARDRVRAFMKWLDR